jgi:hypothetical protein
MHPSAMNNAAQFFDTYSAAIPMEDKPRVIDIGAQDVNGSLRQVTPPQFEYVGLDFQKAKGVDVILEDPYVLPLADASVDCWRFYPDSGKALISWGKRNGLNPELLESFTQIGGRWQDYIAVFLKDSAEIGRFPARILDRKKDFENGQRHGDPELLNQTQTCQNDRKLDAIGSIAAEKMIVR